jgi:hypothetical protein
MPVVCAFQGARPQRVGEIPLSSAYVDGQQLALRPPLALSFQPLTAQRRQDLERFCDERGVCGGCWCMCALAMHWNPAREPSAAVYSVLAFSHAAMNVRALAAISSGPSPGE